MEDSTAAALALWASLVRDRPVSGSLVRDLPVLESYVRDGGVFGGLVGAGEQPVSPFRARVGLLLHGDQAGRVLLGVRVLGARVGVGAHAGVGGVPVGVGVRPVSASRLAWPRLLRRGPHSATIARWCGGKFGTVSVTGSGGSAPATIIDGVDDLCDRIAEDRRQGRP